MQILSKYTVFVLAKTKKKKKDQKLARFKVTIYKKEKVMAKVFFYT